MRMEICRVRMRKVASEEVIVVARDCARLVCAGNPYGGIREGGAVDGLTEKSL